MLTAGPVTALTLADRLARTLGLPLRVVTTLHYHGRSERADAERALRARLARPDLTVAHVGQGRTGVVGADDVWVATLWSTALALDVACRLGLVDRSQVVYLVQDYEPAFHAWSTAFAAAQAGYHAGFRLVVNTTTLAEHLQREEGVETDPALVMAPAPDTDRLRTVAGARPPVDAVPDVFLYARPANRRNLYELALATAHRAAASGPEFRLVLAGEDGVPAPSVPGIRTVALGQVDHDGYYDLMRTSPVALSLMMSPHPSHPTLDWAVSGGWTVTHAFGASRDGLHPRLLTARADPDELGALLARTVAAAAAGGVAPYEPLTRDLGRPLDAVVGRLTEVLDRS